jgi:hypothetical protein
MPNEEASKMSCYPNSTNIAINLPPRWKILQGIRSRIADAISNLSALLFHPRFLYKGIAAWYSEKNALTGFPEAEPGMSRE